MATLLEALGNALDLPGSMVRDVMAAKNPLDQLRSPFSQDNRMSGQDVLSRWGMGDDHDMLGFGLETVTDPLSLLGLGMAKKGLTGLNVIGKGSKLGKARSLVTSLFKSPEAARDAWKAMGSVATQAVARNPENASTALVELPGLMERAYSSAARKLSNPDLKKTAKGLGLAQLLSMGRGSREMPEADDYFDPYYQQGV